MRKLLLLFSLSVIALQSFAQDKTLSLPTSMDPSYLYIQKYMPEYYYEGYVVDGERSISAPKLTVKVRVLRNYVDEKTFSYLVLRNGPEGEYVTLFPDEIDSLVKYLERVLEQMNIKPENNNYYVYNSQMGLFFKTEWVAQCCYAAFAPVLYA